MPTNILLPSNLPTTSWLLENTSIKLAPSVGANVYKLGYVVLSLNETIAYTISSKPLILRNWQSDWLIDFLIFWGLIDNEIRDPINNSKTLVGSRKKVNDGWVSDPHCATSILVNAISRSKFNTDQEINIHTYESMSYDNDFGTENDGETSSYNLIRAPRMPENLKDAMDRMQIIWARIKKKQKNVSVVESTYHYPLY